MDYCTAGPQYASGGFIADSNLPFVVNGSQQQWLTRNSAVGRLDQRRLEPGLLRASSAHPTTPASRTRRTRRSTRPRSAARSRTCSSTQRAATTSACRRRRPTTSGISWGDGETRDAASRSRDFFIATPHDSVKQINNALARGKHLLLTPGVYDIDRTIEVKRADTVVLGMGHATLTAVGGAVPLEVADAAGIIVAGVTIDAGTISRRCCCRSARRTAAPEARPEQPDHAQRRVLPRRRPARRQDHALALEVNSDNVLIDHTWVWRADHGIEGFTRRNGDTERWNTNIGTNGVIVNGDERDRDRPVRRALPAVQHRLERRERPRILYQNELPYDPPTQADWTQPDGTLGYPGYKVADQVTTHSLYGAGVYVFNQNNPSILTENGFEVPETPGRAAAPHHDGQPRAGTIEHVVNDIGGQVDNSATGVPQYVVDFPVP